MCEGSVMQVKFMTSVCCMPQHEQVWGACGTKACTEVLLSWVHGANGTPRSRDSGCWGAVWWTALSMWVGKCVTLAV